MRTAPLACALAAGCLSPDAPRPLPAPLRVLDARGATGDLQHLPRVPALRVRFDRALAPPDPDALILVAGAPTSALEADAARGSLSATHAARRVPATLSRAPDDPSALVLRAASPLLPDAALTLLVTWRATARDGGALAHGDARSLALAASVAPARRCGALASLAVTDPADVPRVPGRLYVRFDRAVRRLDGEALTLVRDGGEGVPSRADLDCVAPDGAARCAWLEPARVLDAGARYRLVPGALAARNDAAAEDAGLAFSVGAAMTGAAAALGPSPVCASGEDPRPPFCVRVGDRWVELRATTPAPAVLRAEAVGGGATRAALAGPGVHHTLRVEGLAPGVTYRVTVWAHGTDGTAHDARAVDGVATGRALPRVRITEVVARPRSTSAQEYVELVNEGDAPADLAGYALEQAPSRSVFAEGTVLPAGARAVVVGPSFDPRGAPRQGDPPVAPGAVMVVLRGAVAGRGLRDAGADLALVDPAGRVLSFVPGAHPARAPREGVGLVRADTELLDDDPAAWTYDADGGATPGAPDRLR